MIEATKNATPDFESAKELIPTRFKPAAREIFYLLRGLRYVGNTKSCPCCGWHFQKFLPCSETLRPGITCPRCGSLGRHRLMALYFKNRTRLFSDRLKVLHFAPEFCIQRLLEGLTNIEYNSADLDSPWARTRIDITQIPEPDNSYDIVLCSHVLEHVPEDRVAMREICRILKPGGWAILQVPVQWDRPNTYEDPSILAPEERLKAFGQIDHVRIYGNDYLDRLRDAGFDATVDRYVQTFEPAQIEGYGLPPNEGIVVCRKPSKI
jgi:SAM-dependent methyltransferase